ncbi:TPA: DUF4274 domain-containing protein [Neisseria bacilliformis]
MHELMAHYNYDDGAGLPAWVVAHPACTLATRAAGVLTVPSRRLLPRPRLAAKHAGGHRLRYCAADCGD